MFTMISLEIILEAEATKKNILLHRLRSVSRTFAVSVNERLIDMFIV